MVPGIASCPSDALPHRQATAPERGWREVVNLLALVVFIGLLVHYTMPDELS